MGYAIRKIEVHLRLHAEQDRRLADEIEQRIMDMLAEPQFEHLRGWITTS